MYDTHCQIERRKYLIPQLVGIPPKYPKMNSEGNPINQQAANEFALFMLTMFSPWNNKLPVDYKHNEGILVYILLFYYY